MSLISWPSQPAENTKTALKTHSAVLSAENQQPKTPALFNSFLTLPNAVTFHTAPQAVVTPTTALVSLLLYKQFAIIM